MKIISTIFSATLLFLFSTNLVFAEDLDSSKEVVNGENVQISVTNNETGEVTYIDIEDKDTKFESIGNLDDIALLEQSSEIKGYEVFIPIPHEKEESTSDSGQIAPLDVKDGGLEVQGVKASLYVDYDVSSDNEKVRLNRVYGSWQPDDLYTVSNREVTAHSGSWSGNKLSKTPTSNYFSYTTGWGYNDRLGGDLSPRAWSSADVSPSGMGGTVTVKVEFAYANDL